MPHHYSEIFESMPLGVIIIDLQGQIQVMNPRAKALLNMDEAFDNRPLHALPVMPTLPLDGKGRLPDKFEVSGRRIIGSDGRIMEMTGGPLRGEGGVLSGGIVTLKDITEMERLREQENNDEKYAAMGELSADIAHEIRNPLGSISLLASLLAKELKRKKDINRANQILAAVRNMENKISSLIQFSKTYHLPVRSVNIHDVLKDILNFSNQIADRESAFLSVHYAEIEPVVEGNPDMLKQVFLNLTLNALQALPESSRLDISTRHFAEQGAIEIHFIEKCSGAPEDPRSDILLRLSHAQEKNWGLGLAIIHNIIDLYHGSVRLEYAEEAGTAFVLTFPLISALTKPEDKDIRL